MTLGELEGMALAVMSDGMNLLVVSTIFASFLIPISVVLFTFSPSTIWRSPLFILNVLAIILGLTEQGLYIHAIINTTVKLGGVPTSLVVMIVAMAFLVPICVQGILLVRLVAAYPPASNSRQQNLAIYVPVVAFKIACLINVGYMMRALIGHLPDSLGAIGAMQFTWRTKYVKVEWFLQLFDDMFMSGLFVHKLYASAVMKRGIKGITSQSSTGSFYLWAERIRTLYYIALSNFVFPILFNVAQIVTIFTDPFFFHGVIIVTVNSHVTIIGVLLATVWAQSSKRDNWKPHASIRSRHHRTPAVPSFVEFASYNLESQMPAEDADSEDESEGDFDVGPQMLKQASEQDCAGEAPPASTPTPTPKERSVLFQSVGGSTAVVVITQNTTHEEAKLEEKGISKCSLDSSGGTTRADPVPGPEPVLELHK